MTIQPCVPALKLFRTPIYTALAFQYITPFNREFSRTPADINRCLWQFDEMGVNRVETQELVVVGNTVLVLGMFVVTSGGGGENEVAVVEDKKSGPGSSVTVVKFASDDSDTTWQ